MVDEKKTPQEENLDDEKLSKAIDSLIEEHFSTPKEGEEEIKKSEEDISKANGQPENKIDELPKDTDVKANGGKDVIKAKKDEEEDKKEDEEKAKKSVEAQEPVQEKLFSPVNFDKDCKQEFL